MRRRNFVNRVLYVSAAGAVSALTASFSLGQTNLLLDPGFESGNAAITANSGRDTAISTVAGTPWLGWNNWVSPYSAFFSQEVAPHSGSSVAKTFSTPNGGVYQYVNVIPGDTYTASAWFLNTSIAGDTLRGGETEDVRMIFNSGLNGTGNGLGTFVTPVPVSDLTPTDQWTQLSISAVAPAGTQQVQWMAFFNNPNGSLSISVAGALFVDDGALIDTTPTWNGGAGPANNVWSTGTNWSGGASPGAGGNVVFDGTTSLASVNDFDAGTGFGAIRFNPTAGSFVVSGNDIGLGGDITNNSPNTQTINLNLALGQNTNFNAAAGNLVIGGNVSGAFSVTANGANTVTLNGSGNSYSGGTNVSAGQLVIGAAGALPANSAVTITGGNLKLGTGTGGETLSSLTISGTGTFDIANNHFLLSYGSVSPATTIISEIKTGKIFSSAGKSGYGVAFGDGADGEVHGVSSGTIKVSYTLFGDINQDGVVNGTDFGILAGNFGKTVTGGWEQGDLNYDTTVNGTDFGLLAGNFGKSASGVAVALPASQWAALDAFAASHGLLADVPEPTTGAILAAGALIGCGRRRRRA
jgi:autotransporter-associated beta strand protein